MGPMITGGWLPDPPKADDWKFTDLKPRLATISSDGEYLIPIRTPVSHQGQLKSCAANATADALEILLGLNGQVTQLSRLFIYYNARNYHGGTHEDGGTYLRMAFEGIKKLGVCPEDAWKYVPENVNLRPPVRAYHLANDNQVTGFYRITSQGQARADDIEAALRANHPVTFGTQLGPEFLTYRSGEERVFHLPTEQADQHGRHAMILCGVRRRGGQRHFYVRNSWGTDWGLGGYVWLDESYIASPKSSDFWVPTVMNLI